MPAKLIIFDLDGTLVDTSQDITDALNYALRPYGLKNLTVSDVIGMIGEGISSLVEKILSPEKTHLKDEVVKRFLEYYSEHLTDHSREYPNVREILEKLAGFKKAVISNKRESLSKRLLMELDLLVYFDLVVGSDTAGEKKPSAIPVLYVLSELGMSPREVLFVGDSNHDIEAGKKAGVKTVAVTYGYRPKIVLKDADYMIDNLKELIPLLYE